MRNVVVNMGAEDFDSAASPTSFAGLPLAGPGRLYLFTCADDTDDEAGESLAFNGTVVPGVGYNENLGHTRA